MMYCLLNYISVDVFYMSSPLINSLLIVLGGGGLFGPYDANFSEKCPCSHNNYSALIKQLTLFDTSVGMTNTFFELSSNNNLSLY